MNKFNRYPGTAITVAIPEPNLAAVPEAAAPQGISMAQITPILRAYWKHIIVITLLVAGLAAVVIKFLPRTYTATVTLIVSSDLKDPLAGRDFPAEMMAGYVSTQIELMTSPIVLLPVVKQLNLTQDKDFTAGFSGSDAALGEFVEKALSADLQVERGIGGQLMYVSASSKNAAKAADIANAVADIYIAQDRRRLNDPAGERAQRYTEELSELREKATVAQDKVTEFRKENGIGDMSSATATGTEIQSLDSLNQRLLETRNARRALEAKLAGGAPSDANMPASVLDAQLAQLAQLSTTYGPQHPKVRELNAQIAATRHLQSAGVESELASTIELERKYRQAVAEQEAKVTKLRQAQDEGSKLVLELDSAKSVYKQALDGFDKIMFQAVASHTNVTVVNRAVAPLQASKPKKVKLFLGAIIFALALGFGLPLAHGLFLARRLRCRDDVERDFGIAVLAQLEAVPALAGAT